MADVVLSAPPFHLIKPKLTVGATGSQVQYECSANEVDAIPEQDQIDDETFCGTFTSYKPEKWTITVSILQSFGATGFWTAMRPLANTIQPFTLLPDATQAISAANPEMRGTAYIPGFAFLAAAVGEASDFDFILNVQGIPTWAVTPVLEDETRSGDEESAAA